MSEAVRDLLWVIGIFVVLGFIWFFTGGPNRSSTQKPFIRSPLENKSSVSARPANSGTSAQTPSRTSGSGGGTPTGDPTRSIWSGKVNLSLGSARSEVQPAKEYLRLTSRAQEPVTITGWKLVDSKQKVAYQAPTVLIPAGVKLHDPRSAKILQPIVLEPGDQANLITGRMPTLSPYPIDVSFKVNMCSGYLEDLPSYQFTPPISSRCPTPVKVSGVENLDDDCYTFVKRLKYCHAPVFGSVRDSHGELQSGYVDTTPNLSSQCKDFLKRNYSYTACLDRSRSEHDFYGQTWYIYLNLGYELWGKERETISLYDQSGLLVDQISY
jgi:hypothetical protein